MSIIQETKSLRGTGAKSKVRLLNGMAHGEVYEDPSRDNQLFTRGGKKRDGLRQYLKPLSNGDTAIVFPRKQTKNEN